VRANSLLKKITAAIIITVVAHNVQKWAASDR
jgi:hypothetical protein